MDALKLDLMNSPLSRDLHYPLDPNMLVDLYSSVLREALDKHATEVSRAITLHPHALLNVKNGAVNGLIGHLVLWCTSRSTMINVAATPHWLNTAKLSTTSPKLRRPTTKTCFT